MSNLFLIDCSGYIYRAFFTIPAMINPEGQSVNALYGFVAMMQRLSRRIEKAGGEHVAAVFDHPEARERGWRRALSPIYKANREPTKPELAVQFGLVREAAAEMNLPIVESHSWEADDLICTYARQAAIQGFDVVVISSDKDMMQLILPPSPHHSGSIRMWDPLKRDFIGPDQIEKKFGCSDSSLLPLAQAMIGDTVDNVIGVPGIGPKIGGALASEFGGDIETMIAAAREGAIEPRRIGKLILTHEAELRLSYRLVTLHDDAPLPFPLADLKYSGMSVERLRPFLERQGFGALIEGGDDD